MEAPDAQITNHCSNPHHVFPMVSGEKPVHIIPQKQGRIIQLTILLDPGAWTLHPR